MRQRSDVLHQSVRCTPVLALAPLVAGGLVLPGGDAGEGAMEAAAPLV
jgi:hypothetical protein